MRYCPIGLPCLTTVLLLAGCGNGITELPVVPVTGIVIVDGEPMGKLMITLDPQMPNGRPASAVTGPDGKFVMETPSQGAGAAVGKYRVAVSDTLPPQAAKAVPPVVSTDGLAVETENEKTRGGQTPVAVLPPQTRISARYAKFDQSLLTIEIPEKGLTAWELELSTKEMP